MNWRRFKSVLEITTNIAVLVAAVVMIYVFASGYLASGKNDQRPNSLPKGSQFNFRGVDYRKAPRTLILALNTRCSYCTKSIPFYRQLLEAQSRGNSGAKIIAIFPDAQKDIGEYLQEHHLPLDALPKVDLMALNIDSTPTLVVLDNGGKVINSWVGRLSKDGEREVFRTMGLTAPAPEEAEHTAVGVSKTVDIYNENSPIQSLQPTVQTENDVLRFINLFDVDDSSNTYLLVKGDTLIKYDSQGREVGGVTAPPFKGSFCVDGEGNIYLPTEEGFSVLSPSLKPSRNIPLPNLFSGRSTTLKTVFDRTRGYLYAQVYRSDPLEQVLYRIDPKTLEVRTVFQLEDPVRFAPNYAPGAFDFAVGKKYLYVSDIRQYKIHLLSPHDGSPIRTYSKPYTPQEIGDDDGKFPLRKMEIAGLKDTGLETYPPIFRLNITNNDYLLVWTSRRDRNHKQVVEIYDNEMNFVGTDLKYVHPERNSYVFVNGKVFVPDFGAARASLNTPLSPLEIPGKPFALKVFDDSLVRAKG